MFQCNNILFYSVNGNVYNNEFHVTMHYNLLIITQCIVTQKIFTLLMGKISMHKKYGNS